jgi:hypothetical protein
MQNLLARRASEGYASWDNMLRLEGFSATLASASG